MAQIAETSVKIEIKSPSAKLYDFMRYDMTKLCNSSPQLLKRGEVIEGKEGQVGNVILYEYVLGKILYVRMPASSSAREYIYLFFEKYVSKHVNYLCTSIGTATLVAKVKTAKIDDKERTLNFQVIEGEVLQLYPTFLVKVTVSEGIVDWSIEYEKANESIPVPNDYAKFFAEIVKAADAHLLSH